MHLATQVGRQKGPTHAGVEPDKILVLAAWSHAIYVRQRLAVRCVQPGNMLGHLQSRLRGMPAREQSFSTTRQPT